MARAASEAELALFRTAGQHSRLYLAIHAPSTVYSCRVNGAPEVNDSVAELTYDGGTGTYTNILPGMTLYVGSSAGAYDKGMARIRRAASATKLFIAETSDIAFADNDYLTIVSEFGLWAKHLRIAGGSTFMDYDIAYSDQHKYPAPTPILGTDRVLWLTGATVSHDRTAAGSYVTNSGTISSYAWAAPSSSALTNNTTETATITYNAASGMAGYLESCTLTSADSKAFTGYRQTWVFDAAHPPVTDFTLDNCRGDYESGGWEFTVLMKDSAALTTVRDRAKVVLFSVDYYGATQDEIGPVAGSENVIASGWIDGESIEWNPEQGGVKFTAKGPAYWMGQMQSFPVGVKNTGSDPSKWIRFKDLTVDKGLWHFLHYRTTATAVLDCYLTGDSKALPSAESPAGSLWAQLVDIADLSILAKPACDRYGRLFVDVNQQYLPDADRSTIPVILAITKPDWRETLNFDRVSVSKVGQVVASGVSYNGTKASPLWSKAPGNVPKRYGEPEPVENLLFANQAGANVTAGMILANRNNEYPALPIPLSANNRLIDICPQQYVTLTCAAGDTERGISFTDKKFIPRRVEYSIDPEEGNALFVDIEVEAETTGVAGITYIPPKPPPAQPYEPPSPEEPSFPPFPPPYIPWFPPVPPTPIEPPITDCTTDMAAPPNAFPVAFYPVQLASSESAEADRTSYGLTGACYVRAAEADYPSYVYFPFNSCAFGRWIDSVWYTDNPASWVHVYAVDASKNVVLNGSALQRVTNGWISNFTPVGATAIAGIKVVIDQDGYEASGSVTLSQQALVLDPNNGGTSAAWESFVGGLVVVTAYNNKWVYFTWLMEVGEMSLPNGNIIATFSVTSDAPPPEFSGQYDVVAPGAYPQVGRLGLSKPPVGTDYEWTIYGTGDSYAFRDGCFGVKIGWESFPPWNLYARLVKLQWRQSAAPNTVYDLWGGTLTTGRIAYLGGTQICNVCPEE